MDRAEFMRQLERLLGDIPESDRLDAIAYYHDYFDEAGPENETQVIRELGSPEKVAAIIKADLNSSGNEQAEYMENGYSDGRSGVNPNTPITKETNDQGQKKKRDFPWALMIVLIVFASPLLIGVGGGLLGGLIGILGGLFGVVVAVIACSFAFLVAGIVCFVFGIFRLAISPAEGLVTMGVGSLLLALGILFSLLFIWGAFKWLPALFRGVINLCQRILHIGERRSKA